MSPPIPPPRLPSKEGEWADPPFPRAVSRARMAVNRKSELVEVKESILFVVLAAPSGGTPPKVPMTEL